MGWIKDEFSTLRPLVILIVSTGIAFGVAWVYRMGYEAGMINGMNNLEQLQDAETAEQVERDAERIRKFGYTPQSSSGDLD